MYKLLIADDNSLILENMRTLVKWESYDIEISALCNNGREAWEYIKNNDIDIVIADVEMPEMNGLELLNKIRQSGRNIKFVFISCYDKFEFIHSALSLDAVGYLLKPIIEEELEKVLQKLLDRYESEQNMCLQQDELIRIMQSSLVDMREIFFRNLSFGAYIEEDEIYENLKVLNVNVRENDKIQVVAIRIGKSVNEESLHNKMLYTSAIMQNISEKDMDECSVFPFVVSNDKIAIVCIYGEEQQEKIIDNYMEIKEFCSGNVGVKTSMGISESAKSIAETHTLYLQAWRAADTELYGDEERIVMYSEICEESDITDFFYADTLALKTKIGKIIGDQDKNGAAEFVNDYFKGVEQDNVNITILRGASFQLLNMIEVVMLELNIMATNIVEHKLMWEKLLNFETIFDIRQWFYNILCSVFEAIDKNIQGRNEKLINDVKELISREYGSKLTLKRISNELHYSGAYINTFFQKETGMTIFDYLTKYRMEMAKEMLLKDGSKINMIAQEVGYKNYSHFCEVFKQYVGLKPLQYKLNAQGILNNKQN